MLTSVDRFMTGDCAVEKGSKVCRSRGGESCAFDGAMIVLQPIADTAHIVHGTIACAGNSWESRGSLSSHGNLHKMGFTTAMNELDIIYGSEEKLLNAIKKVHLELKPKAIFVYTTCVSGLIGEDIESVCRKAEEELDTKVIPVNAPGFVGPKNLGNRIAGEVLLDHVIGTGEAPFVTDYDINLIGEYNIAGDQWLVEPVLHEAGFRILSRITGDASFEEITYAHRAKLNVVVCGRALINVAQQMERKYGIPYVEVSFFGKTEMRNALRAIGSALDLRNLANATNLVSPVFNKVEIVIDKEEKKLDHRLAEYKHLVGKKAVLYSGGVKSWSLISALGDLGIEVVGVGTKKSTFDDEAKMRAIISPNADLIEDTSPKNLLSIIRSKGADMLIAGGRNQYLGVKEGIPFVDVNQERHTPYASYEGLLKLAEQISNGLRYYERESIRSVRDEKRDINTQIQDIMIDPLQHSPAIGAAIAFQGVHNALPIIHGAQGCNFLGKVLMTKHFREPVAMATTKLFTEDVVMGSDEALIKTVESFIEKNNPDVIGVLSAALSEVKGDDVASALKNVQLNSIKQNGSEASKLIHVSVPDYVGSIETGYAAAVKQLIGLANPLAESKEISSKKIVQINVLVGSHLTPADVSELREIIESFELTPIILPDLSALDGSRQGVSASATGGTKLGEIKAMGLSGYTLAIGASMGESAKMLKDRFNIDYQVFESISGLRDTDEFLQSLSRISGNRIPVKYERQRKVLLDNMRDAHFYLSGKKICIALETDITIQLSRCLNEAGADIELAVIPNASSSANGIDNEVNYIAGNSNAGDNRKNGTGDSSNGMESIDNTSGAKSPGSCNDSKGSRGSSTTDKIVAHDVVVGDLFSIQGYFDLLISNSHGENTAEKLGVPLYQMGFPTYKVFGATTRITIGYDGMLGLIRDVANIFIKH